MEIGIMLSVAVGDHPGQEHLTPDEQLKKAKAVGVNNVQLGCPPDEFLAGDGFMSLKKQIEESGIRVTTVFCGFEGESYADIPTVKQTVGYVPEETRAERIEKTYAISEFAKGLGVDAVAAHIGFIPHDEEDPLFQAMVETMRKIADYCAQNGQVFSLETGQETGEALLHFLKAVDRENLKVNFDPANMILYGCGEPIAAMEEVKEHIVSVHAKDASWSEHPGETWGTETPLGEGDVGMDRFVEKLKQIGFDGYITIEREIAGPEQIEDMKKGVALLRGLVEDGKGRKGK